MVVRDVDKGRRLENEFGVRTYRTLDELLTVDSPEFAVVSVPWPVCPDYIAQLTERNVPVLSETPPAPDREGLVALHRFTEAGAKVQVAEQYPYQPHNQAALHVIASGRLGTVSQAQVSQAHGYHGIALIRRFLNTGLGEVSITAKRFKSPITAGPSRKGTPPEQRMASSTQDMAWFEFGEKLGVFDFTGDQYFSWIRTSRLLIRGEKGELSGDQINWLRSFDMPVHSGLRRVNAGENGNLEGFYLKGIMCGEEWVYKNPLAPARLTDDEVAVATCLLNMSEYVKGGPSFYSLAEASHDHYLNLLLGEAVQTGQTVRSEHMPWMNRS
jgi:predicted dehydrogenase